MLSHGTQGLGDQVSHSYILRVISSTPLPGVISVMLLRQGVGAHSLLCCSRWEIGPGFPNGVASEEWVQFCAVMSPRPYVETEATDRHQHRPLLPWTPTQTSATTDTHTDLCCTDIHTDLCCTDTPHTDLDCTDTHTDHSCHRHPQTTAATDIHRPLLHRHPHRPLLSQTSTQTTVATDIHTDQCYDRATGADIALGSSLGLNITMTLGGKKATGLSPLLTSFLSTEYESLCLSLFHIQSGICSP